jgi:hypothetical protein
MRPLVAAILALLVLTRAGAGGVANAQEVPAGPPGPQAPDGEQPPAPTAQAPDHEQPRASRPQAADREQPVRVRQRNYGASGSGRKHVGLLIGGLITLGASYGFTAAVGIQLMSRSSMGGSSGSSICTNCDSVGGRLMIPLVGPWAALPASAPDGKPILVGLGIVQAAGLIMTIAGAARLNDDSSADDVPPPSHPPAPQWRSNGRVSFLLVPSRDGAFGLLSGSL